MNTYSRYPVAMVEGKGCRLKDAEGNEYLDFLSGIAVCSLGHCHPAVTQAICNQAGKLAHVSNLYHTLPQTELAELLIAHSFADRVFMCNSGAEANEAAIKLARKHGGEGRYEIISLESSFHGRTLAAIAATGQPKFHKGFEPLPIGFIHAPFGDIEALTNLVSAKTCAILCEPLQGEGGVRPLEKEYLAAIRALCNKHNLLLIFDEVQVGMGRTGTLFAYEQFGITPDVMTLAKAMANGLPIGAVLAREEVAASFDPGSHASTFGGNPIASAAATVVVKTLLAGDFLEQVREKGGYLAARLADLVSRYPEIAISVRGLGLIQGLVLSPEYICKGTEIINKLFARRILANFAGNKALRFLPPLIISHADIDILHHELDVIFSENH
ncbi:MAG: aspartate aminotransferase family protein [Proteobacteria bacterium]|nr:aspartate aminotransferase family protein [Pseudomonadota bacterium]MBU1737516.1 aspartate aminotransferase family protein [Pseudomonadota bacterium]